MFFTWTLLASVKILEIKFFFHLLHLHLHQLPPLQQKKEKKFSTRPILVVLRTIQTKLPTAKNDENQNRLNNIKLMRVFFFTAQ